MYLIYKRLTIVGNFTIFPFLFHSKDIEVFCGELEDNVKIRTIEDIKYLAENKGFSVSDNSKNKSLIIYDKKTIGKFTCDIDYGGSEIKYRYFSD